MTAAATGDDWWINDSGAFVGMSVELADGREGEILAIWEYKGSPTRIDIDTDEGVRVNVGKDSDEWEVTR